jgi:hypothetical protein
VPEFCKVHQIDYSSIRNKAFVARAVPLKKRHEKLSFAYHEAVAQMDLFKEKEKMLSKAEVDGLSISELRQAVRVAQGSEQSAVSEGKEVRFASKFADGLVDWIANLPTDFFSDSARRTIWKERLRPIAELYAKL